MATILRAGHPHKAPLRAASPSLPLGVPQGDTVGIGGWLCTKDGFHWFSEIWSMYEVRALWPQLLKLRDACGVSPAADGPQPPGPQIPLLRNGRRLRQHAHRSRSQQAPLHSLASQPFPSPSGFMVARTLCSLAVSHVSGQKNVWADELSRDKLDRFRCKPSARFRFTLSQLCQPEGITLHPPLMPDGGKILWKPRHEAAREADKKNSFQCAQLSPVRTALRLHSQLSELSKCSGQTLRRRLGHSPRILLPLRHLFRPT